MISILGRLIRAKVLGVFLIISQSVSGQLETSYLSLHGGGYYYLGDLAPLASVFSVSAYNPALAVSYGSAWHEYYNVELRLGWGRLSGDDAEAKSKGRQSRNLSFVSSLYELGVLADVSINQWLSGLDKYGLRLYYSTGVNLFHFNPKTTYQGMLVALQPLGTEGQGSSELNSAEKYSLTQISIPFGISVEFDLNTRFFMGFEIMPRWTFTDHLDDVSGAYMPYDQLAEANGELAAILSDRSGELLNGTNIPKPAGALRGDPNDNDWYLYVGLNLSYRLGEITEMPEKEVEINDK